MTVSAYRRCWDGLRGPLVVPVHDQAARYVCGRVEGAGQVGVVGRVAEHLRPEPNLAGRRPGVGVEQQLGRVAADPAARIVRAGRAVPVRLPGADARHERVPDAAVAIRHRDPGLHTLLVEQAQQHSVGDSRGDREVGAAVPDGGAEREPHAGPRCPGGAHAAHCCGPSGPDRFPEGVADGGHRSVPSSDHVGHEPGPARLVRRAEPGPVVAVEVLAEHQVVLPGRVVLHPLDTPEARTSPVRTDHEDRGQPFTQIRDDGGQGQLPAGPCRVLDRVVVAEEAVVALQRADHHVVQREPQRTAPVGVAAEHRGGRFGGFVVDSRPYAVDLELVRVLAVVGGHGPQPVGREELLLVEELGEQPLQPVDADDAEQHSPLSRSAPEQAGIGELLPVVQAFTLEELREVLGDQQCPVEHRLVDDPGGQHGNDAHHGPDLDRHSRPVRGDQAVVEQPVGVVPQPLVGDGTADRREMLEELED